MKDSFSIKTVGLLLTSMATLLVVAMEMWKQDSFKTNKPYKESYSHLFLHLLFCHIFCDTLSVHFVPRVSCLFVVMYGGIFVEPAVLFIEVILRFSCFLVQR